MNESMVDAIDDGRIVRISEERARREGLPIIRRYGDEEKAVHYKKDYSQLSSDKSISMSRTKRTSAGSGILSFEEYRRPLRTSANDVINELVSNFHWIIQKTRREKGLTRKQFALALSVPEQDVKLIENGRLPKNDFVLVNKIQDYLGINLRKDGKDFSKTAREMIEESSEEEKKNNLKDEEIEILDE